MIDGNQLKAFREAQGWTLYQLKQATGVHQGLLARVEKGMIQHLQPHHEAALNAIMEGRPVDPVPSVPYLSRVQAEVAPIVVSRNRPQ